MSAIIDIVSDFTWTTTPKEARKEVPTLQVKAFSANDPMFWRQLKFYFDGVSKVLSGAEKNDNLEPYARLWESSEHRGSFRFPFFVDSYLNISTSDWESIDGYEGLKDMGSSILQVIGGRALANMAARAADAGTAVAQTAASMVSPKVGVMDRPALFSTHNKRTLSVNFPLFNTYRTEDIARNLSFIEFFAKINLFKKTTYFTGLPPCFYQIKADGQYYCLASFVSDFTVNSRGNTRYMEVSGKRRNIPDVFEISIGFCELVMPSLNQYQEALDSRVLVERSGA